MNKKHIFIFILIFFFSVLCFSDTNSSSVDAYNSGIISQNEGHHYKAIEFYKSALDKNPNYLEPIIGLAESYFALSEYKEALKYITTAQKYDSSDVIIKNLEGRIRIGLGDFNKAKDIFADVLKHEPNNIDANFGFAELDIAGGKIKNARNRFLEALNISPYNRRALLSLVMLYDELDNNEAADRYIKQSLDYYSGNSIVRYFAAKHYLKNGNLLEAEYQVKTALSIDPEYIDATLLLSKIYLKKAEYLKVIPLLEGVLKKNRNNHLLWYTLGVANRKIKDSDNSIRCFANAFSLQPDDDISQIALENEIMILDMEDPRRNRYAESHFKTGKSLEDKNLLRKALYEYRRGLLLNPYQKEGRILYANIYNKMGFPSKYLSILNVLVKEGCSDINILDEIEIVSSILNSGTAYDWEIDQFSLIRNVYKISVFYMPESSKVDHFLSEEILSEYFQELLYGYENIKPQTPQLTRSFGYSFRIARESDSDYFLILKINESERSINLVCNIYLSETGSLLKSLNVFRTGNNRVKEAFLKLADNINNRLPLSARLIGRKFNKGLIDLGRFDGLKENDKLLIIKKGAVSLSNESFAFNYSDKDILGVFTVTSPDELVSEGLIKKRYFFDLINQGDILVFQKDDEMEIESQMFAPKELYRSFLKIP